MAEPFLSRGAVVEPTLDGPATRLVASLLAVGAAVGTGATAAGQGSHSPTLWGWRALGPLWAPFGFGRVAG